MADAETHSQRLQVAILTPAEGGRGIARLPEAAMKALGLNEGDVIEIVGKRSTAARAIRPYDDDHGLDIIRLDGLQFTRLCGGRPMTTARSTCTLAGARCGSR